MIGVRRWVRRVFGTVTRRGSTDVWSVCDRIDLGVLLPSSPSSSPSPQTHTRPLLRQPLNAHTSTLAHTRTPAHTHTHTFFLSPTLPSFPPPLFSPSSLSFISLSHLSPFSHLSHLSLPVDRQHIDGHCGRLTRLPSFSIWSHCGDRLCPQHLVVEC